MLSAILIGLGIAAVAALLAFGALVFGLRSAGQSPGEVVRVFPDSFRLAVALYRDRTLPRSLRWRLRIALVYNVQPINLIPDSIPVIGLADNVLVLAWALRGTVRTAGTDVVARHWKGSPESLAVLYRALRLSGSPTRPRRLEAAPAIGSAADAVRVGVKEAPWDRG